MNRIIFLIIFLISFISIAFSVYAEFFLKMNPCPLCIVQRTLLIIICIFSLIFSIVSLSRFLNTIFSFILIILNAFNIKVAAHHLWLINLPPEQQPTSCGMPMEVMFKKLSMVNFLHKILEGDAECARAKWKIMGLLAPQLVIILSVIFIILLTYMIFNLKKNKNI